MNSPNSKNIKIVGEKVCLVSYQKKHVIQYNQWLQDPDLLDLTSSEQLTLEEEYANQLECEESDKRYIFMILDNSLDYSLAGDVDIFFDEENNGELNVMIAEKYSRRKGLAKEAVLLIMRWALISTKVSQFVAKIQIKNEPSIFLFQSFGFKETSRSEVFNEITFHLDVNQNMFGNQVLKIEDECQ
jgi:RimJ/RimL family protein N-acetyltransferase